MSAAAPDTWMPLWIGPYLANTLHLNRAQHGSYCLLIMACWKAGGRLPANDATLATIARCSAKEWKAERDVFAAFFEVDPQVWTHPRVMAELIKAKGFQEKQAKNGGKGGRPKKPDETQTEPKQEPKPNPSETTLPLPLPTQAISTPSLADSEREPLGDGAPDDGSSEPVDDDLEYPDFMRRNPTKVPPQFRPAAVPRAQPIPAGWQPSEGALAQLAASRPDIAGEFLDRRMVAFRSWCAAKNVTTFNPDATWLGFMVDTHAQRSRNDRTDERSTSAALAGVAAAASGG